MNILNALKGIGEDYEIARLIGGLGSLVYVVGANVFVAWNLMLGHPFDVTAYCISFPAGLGVAVGATAGAVAIKDRGVETARVIKHTGGQPTSAAPAPTADPQHVVIDQPAGEPVPVKPEGAGIA